MADTDAGATPGPEPLMSAEALAGLTRALGWLLAVGGAGLALTGLPLVWLYQPDTGGRRGDFWWLRGAHNVMSMVLLGAAAALVAVLVVGFVRRVRVPPGWLVGLGVLAVALLGLVSGQLIAWDRLGPDGLVLRIGHEGVVDAVFGDLRPVVVEGAEVSPGAYAAWAGVHVLAVPLLALGVGWIARRHGTRREERREP